MRVIIQPRDGVEPLIEGIGQAKTSVEIIIYRLDRLEIEQALIEAAAPSCSPSISLSLTFTTAAPSASLRKTRLWLTRRFTCLKLTPSGQYVYRSIDI